MKYFRKLTHAVIVFVLSITMALSGNMAYSRVEGKIKLPVKALKMYVGDSYKFKVKNCSWKTSNKKVVKVSKNGKVKAKKAGKARLTVRKNNKKSKTVVNVKVGKHATGIKINGAASIFLNMGQTWKIQAAVTPAKVLYKNVEYNVADTSVASVSKNGTITPKSPGVTGVTIVSKATSAKNKKLSVSVNVIVTDGTDSDSRLNLTYTHIGYDNIVTPEKMPDQPVSMPSLPATIQEYISALTPDNNEPIAGSCVVANAAGEKRTVYLLNKNYTGDISIFIDGYSYSSSGNVGDFLNRLEIEAGGSTNSAGTVNVIRKKKTESWKITLYETGSIYYMAGKAQDTIYNSQFGIIIAEGDTTNHISVVKK